MGYLPGKIPGLPQRPEPNPGWHLLPDIIYSVVFFSARGSITKDWKQLRDQAQRSHRRIFRFGDVRIPPWQQKFSIKVSQMSNDDNDLTLKDVQRRDSYKEDSIDRCVCASPLISSVLVGDLSLSDAEAAELVSIDFTAEVDIHLDATYSTSFDASSEDLSGTADQMTVDVDEAVKIVEEDSNEARQLIVHGDDSLVEEQIEVNLSTESDAEFAMNASTTRKDVIIRDSSNPFDSKIQKNPFDDDDAEICGEEFHSIVSSSNPFDKDELDTGTAGSYSGATAKRIPTIMREKSVVEGKTVVLKIGKDKEKEPFNPFCDGDMEDEISEGKEQTLGQRKLAAESSVYSTAAPSEFTDRKNVRSPSSTFHSQHHSTETNQKIMFPREMNELRSLGFEPASVMRTLQTTSGDVVAARKLLLSTLFDNKTGFSNDEVCVWKSPVIVRVGEFF